MRLAVAAAEIVRAAFVCEAMTSEWQPPGRERTEHAVCRAILFAITNPGGGRVSGGRFRRRAFARRAAARVLSRRVPGEILDRLCHDRECLAPERGRGKQRRLRDAEIPDAQKHFVSTGCHYRSSS
jgi:hypothetical protein